MSSKGLPPGEDYGLEATDYYDPPLVTMANFKGVGEGGVIGAVPSLTNAVAGALAGLGGT